MKKLITMILIFLLIININISNDRVWAKNPDDVSSGKPESQSSENAVGSELATIAKLCSAVVRLGANLAIGSESTNNTPEFTIENLVLNKIPLFDVNFMNVPDNTNLAMYQRVDSNTIIKQNIAKWYGAIRNLAIAILFLVLIIIGIMMAVNTVASERAKYKKMFANWVASFAILMLMPYIMSIAFYVSEITTDTISKLTEDWKTEYSLEESLIFGNEDKEGLNDKITRSSGWQTFAFTAMLVILVYLQFKFFFMYIKRFFTIGFLVVISPLITITYSIDKANDNQAQAFKKWLSEFLVNLFIQPLHAILYIIFLYSTYEIMFRAPLLAALFLFSLSRGETILRRIFKMDKSMFAGRLGRGRGKR